VSVRLCLVAPAGAAPAAEYVSKLAGHHVQLRHRRSRQHLRDNRLVQALQPLVQDASEVEIAGAIIFLRKLQGMAATFFADTGVDTDAYAKVNKRPERVCKHSGRNISVFGREQQAQKRKRKRDTVEQSSQAEELYHGCTADEWVAWSDGIEIWRQYEVWANNEA